MLVSHKAVSEGGYSFIDESAETNLKIIRQFLHPSNCMGNEMCVIIHTALMRRSLQMCKKMESPVKFLSNYIRCTMLYTMATFCVRCVC